MWRTAIRPPCSVGLKDFGDTPLETRDVARSCAPLAKKSASRLPPPMRTGIGRSPARRTQLAARSQARRLPHPRLEAGGPHPSLEPARRTSLTIPGDRRGGSRRETLMWLVGGVDRVLFSSALSGPAQIAPARRLLQLGWPWAWSHRRGRWMSLMTSREAG
jgi:hypothetical protein